MAISLRIFPSLYFPAICLAILVAMALVGCEGIEAPQREGALVVGALPEPGAIRLPDGSPAEGFTRDFLAAFAKHMGLPLKVIALDRTEDLEVMLRQKKVHIGAYVNTQPAPAGIVFSKTFLSMPMWIVRHADDTGVDSLSDLLGHDVHAVEGSAALVALKALPEHARPNVIEVKQGDQLDLLHRLALREVGLVAADDLNVKIAANIEPNLQPAIQLSGKREVAFAMPEQEDTTLQAQLDGFIANSDENGLLRRLYDRYYGHVQRVGPVLLARYLTDIKTVLPKFRGEFQKAQERTGLDWRLLAALAYQESKWDPAATSSTNVRGMMMLTEETADRLRVDNRLDAAQSIDGGADYLQFLLEQLPHTVPGPERPWFALAAYNLGMGHLNGARAIAKGLNRDADSWYEMKSVLPLLSRPQYYDRLKSGRARGGEAVILVENVRNFYGVLTRIEPPHVLPLSQAGKAKPKQTSKRRLASSNAAQGIRPAQAPGLRLPSPPQ